VKCLSEQIEKIEEIIINEAKAKAEEIITKAKEKAQKILDEAKREAEKEVNEIINRRKADAEARARRIMSEARLEARLKLLNAKEEVISNAFDTALERLKELCQTPEYKEVLENLIKDAAITIGGGNLEVLLSENTNIEPDLSKIAKEVEKQTGTATSIVISKDKVKSIGGAIVRSLDQSFTVDNTFEARLERVREQLRVSVANVLFKT